MKKLMYLGFVTMMICGSNVFAQDDPGKAVTDAIGNLAAGSSSNTSADTDDGKKIKQVAKKEATVNTVNEEMLQKMIAEALKEHPAIKAAEEKAELDKPENLHSKNWADHMTWFIALTFVLLGLGLICSISAIVLAVGRTAMGKTAHDAANALLTRQNEDERRLSLIEREIITLGGNPLPPRV